MQTKYVQKYVFYKFQPDPLMVGFIAVLEQTPQLQQFWCANSKKNPNIDRNIIYLDFVSGHLASAETQCPKKRVTKSIQVASLAIKLFLGIFFGKSLLQEAQK